MKIVLLGNHSVNFSTESHHAWTWEKLGHQVVRLQEDRASERDVLDACRGAQILQWTHTHSFESPVTSQTIQQIRDMGVKSFSYHLDVYWGIGSRQGKYLEHPSFLLDFFFSTDGGNEEKWKQAGINHIYMPPGVVEYGAYLGSADNIDIPVLFAGSEFYHSEYSFRPEMVKALRDNYWDSVRIVSGVREDPLNQLYARTRVVVGDHIFAGNPLYWSDRLPETTGRGGFIVYPDVPGLEEYKKHGLVTYEPQNSQSLINKIDYYLDIGHESDRIERRNSVHEYVRKTQTYTVHLSRILEIMGF